MKKIFTLLLCATLLAACNGNKEDGRDSTGPSEISLSKTTLMMKVDEQSILTVNPKGTTVAWTTSDADVATVNMGIVTAHAVGTAVITAATADGVKATCTVYVPTLAITPSPALLTIGSTLRMEVTVIPEDAAVTWSSSNEDIFTVDDSGTLTGVGPGNGIVTAYSEELGLTATASVNVSREGGEPLSFILDDCESLDGWETAGNNIRLDTDAQEGEYCIAIDVEEMTDRFFQRVIEPAVDASLLSLATAALMFDLYVEDAGGLNLTRTRSGEVEVTSAGIYDKKERHWKFHNDETDHSFVIHDGWNHIKLPFSDAEAWSAEGSFSLDNINWFRLYNVPHTKRDGDPDDEVLPRKPQVMKIDNIRIGLK